MEGTGELEGSHPNGGVAEDVDQQDANKHQQDGAVLADPHSVEVRRWLGQSVQSHDHNQSQGQHNEDVAIALWEDLEEHMSKEVTQKNADTKWNKRWKKG